MSMATRVVVEPGAGEVIHLGGLGVIGKIAAEDTGGSFAVVEHPLEVGTLAAPMHTHSQEDEYSYVLEGMVGVRLGDDEYVAGPGSYIVKPRGVPHTFWNAGDMPARLIEIISPAGFERFFVEMGALMASWEPGAEQDFGALMALGARYGITFHMESVPDLLQRHHLRLG
jgi:quercetin dioxygenase-like cupin family protein